MKKSPFKKHSGEIIGIVIFSGVFLFLLLLIVGNPAIQNYLGNFLSQLEKITLILGAVSAFYIYQDQNGEAKRIAYTEIVLEILRIEQNVDQLYQFMINEQLGNITIYKCPAIMQGDMWSKHKHTLLRKLNHSDIQIIDTFYSNANKIEIARKNIFTSMNEAWAAKASEEMHGISQIISKYNDSEVTADFLSSLPQLNKEIKNYVDVFEKNDNLFTGGVLKGMIVTELKNFHQISTSVTFKKLLDNSYME
nr:MAG TPA: hypothetical protein [Caudoviricetes sp.]